MQAFSERNRLCGEYMPQIAIAEGDDRKKLICKLAEKLFDSFPKRRIILVKTREDIERFNVELEGYFERSVLPHMTPIERDEEECKALDLTIEGCARKWLSLAIKCVDQNEPPSDPGGSTGRTEGGRMTSGGLVDAAAGTIFEGLPPSLIAGFHADLLADVYHDSYAEMAKAADEIFTLELPPGKPCSHMGIRAAALRLSRGLAELTVKYFRRFVTGVEERIAEDSDLAVSAIWRQAVLEEWTNKLWLDIDEVWVTWLNHIRKTTEGTVFGVRPYPKWDPEFEILEAHRRLIKSTLWRVAAEHSIPREKVQEILSAGEVGRQPIIAHSPEPPAARSPGEIRTHEAARDECASPSHDAKSQSTRNILPGSMRRTVAPKLNVELIKGWIDNEGYTNETLAMKLKISERVLSSIRNNGRYHGNDAITKLANAMGRDPADLYLPPEAST